MLTIRVGAADFFDESSETFKSRGGFDVTLEHSLLALSKWEAEYEKPFLSNKEKTPEEALGYIRCMVVGENPPEDFLEKLSQDAIEQVHAYINKKMTATWFSDVTPQTRRQSETVTAELIYYWMTIFQIDMEWETRHLNQLFTLIRICNVKQDKPKKMSRAEAMARQRKINEDRKRQYGTKG